MDIGARPMLDVDQTVFGIVGEVASRIGGHPGTSLREMYEEGLAAAMQWARVRNLPTEILRSSGSSEK